MKILARIEKLAGDQYLMDGTLFDSFLSARREMAALTKRRRLARRQRLSRRASSRVQVAGA